MPRTNKPYKTINKATRDKLEALYNARVPVKQIAVELGYTEQSIYRELKRGFYMHRNSDWTETRKYSADKAQYKANINATAKGARLKIGNDRVFAKFVEDMVLKGFSPAAILGYIKENGLVFKTEICRATLYSYIDKGLFLRISNKNLLHKGKRKRSHKKVRVVKQLPKIEHSIEKRPREVAERITFGHWELDTVVGTQKKGETLLCMTERLTRMEIIFKSPDKSAAATVTMLNRLERKFGSRNFRKVFKSITCDNGTEFSNTVGMEYSPYTGKQRTTVWYCHPYCSSERGSNENQNGFIRRFVPKGTKICSYSPQEILEVQNFINNYPRAIFNWQNSFKMFQNELEKLNIKKIV